MQQVWRKRWSLAGWFALGAITLVLLVSAVSKKNQRVCEGVEINFNKESNNFFVDEREIKNILKYNGFAVGQQIKQTNLRALEGALMANQWIYKADLYFDNQQNLQVEVTEKEPVARIFTVGGNSFYIDSACNKLPLSSKVSARTPMFTNFPSSVNRLSKPDSALLAEAKNLAVTLNADDFWKAQVAQIDITPDGFEMVPTVGNHIVVLGNNGNWKNKLDKLYSFYKQVFVKVGFERYEKLDLRFNKQVVATIKGAKPAYVDSAKARQAYQNILAEVKNVSTPVDDSDKAANTTKGNNAKTIKNFSVSAAAVKSPARAIKQQQQQTTAGRVAAKKVPKAVMKKTGK